MPGWCPGGRSPPRSVGRLAPLLGDRRRRQPDFLVDKGPRLLRPDRRGIDGALIDLEYQRIELIRFNLFDNSGTYREYVRGRDGIPGPALRVWPEMRLPPEHPDFAAVGGAGPQICAGELIRHRTLTGLCNDIRNPLMGSTGMPFGRNVEFEATFPELGRTELARNRHGGRLGLLRPDPQVISRRLLSRPATSPDTCHEGRGLPGHSAEAHCDYKKAPFLNVLAAFWIQFMTHDWFSHLDEGRNSSATMTMGCAMRAGRRGRAAAHARGRGPAGLPCGGPGRRRRGGGGVGSPRVRASGPGTPRPRLPHHPQHRHRLVGRLPALRTRRRLSSAREARSRGSRQAPDGGSRRALGAGGPARLPARVRSRRSHQSPVVRPGNRGLPGQLEHRPQLLPQRVRARAQPLRGGLSAPGGRHSRRRLRTAPSGAARPGGALSGRRAPTSSSRRPGSSSPRRSRRFTRSSGRPSCSTTSLSALPCAPTGSDSPTMGSSGPRSRESSELWPAPGMRTGRPPGTPSSPRGRASSGSATARISTAPPPAGRARRGPTPGASGIPTTSTAGRTTSARRSASPRSS